MTPILFFTHLSEENYNVTLYLYTFDPTDITFCLVNRVPRLPCFLDSDWPGSLSLHAYFFHHSGQYSTSWSRNIPKLTLMGSTF